MKQTKTIPFDWELYNNNRDKYKVVTCDGREITQLTKFENVQNESLIGVLENRTTKWHLNGLHYREVNSKYDLQLQYEEEVVESWVNLYKGCDGVLYTSPPYLNEQIAKEVSLGIKGYIKTINLNDLV
jgi:hypothetical protein